MGSAEGQRAAQELLEDERRSSNGGGEAALNALDPEMVEKCSRICGKTAEKVIEILEEEEA